MKFDFTRIWQKHRQFLTQVFGGAAVFLILVLVSTRMTTGAQDDIERQVALNDKLQQQVANMVDYSRIMADKDTIEEQKEDLLDRLSLPRIVNVPDEVELDDPKFKKKRQSVYSSFTARADRSGLEYPEIEEFSFGRTADWRDRLIQLEVAERVLDQCVDKRVRVLSRIEPGAVRVEQISGNDDIALYRYPVEVECSLRYGDLLLLLDAFQRENAFLSTEIERVSPAGDALPDHVQCELTICGIELAAPREEERKSRGAGFRRSR